MAPAGGSHAGDELLGTRATWLYLVIVFASLVICTFTWSPDTPILVARDHPAVWVAIHLSALVCFTVFCLASALTTRRGLSDIESRNREPERVIENANRAKHASSRFLSTISHELRTPLNGILGMTQFLNLDRLPPTLANSVGTMHICAKKLVKILTGILDLSKLEAKDACEHIRFCNDALYRGCTTEYQ